MDRTLRIMTLGGLAVHGRDGPLGGAAAQPRRLAVLALVARAGQRGATRAKLLAMLWPDNQDDHGRRVLNQALYALRRDLGQNLAIQGAQELRLNKEIVWCDIAEFEAAVARGDLVAAAELYVGPFLDGFRLSDAPEFERWADDERSAIQHRFHDVVEQIARAAESDGAYDRAVFWWRRRAADDPLNARVAVAMMRALAALGDRSGALRQARVFEALVAQELELPPDRAVIELAESLRNPIPTPSAKAAQATRNAAAIAVLQFTYLGTRSDDDEAHHWQDGLADELISALAVLPMLRVAARSASAALGHSPDLVAVSAALGVDYALEGSIRRSPDRVRVTARLIEISSGHALWSERIECALADAHAMQDEIAAALAARVRATFA